jgi:hypothetical protein
MRLYSFTCKRQIGKKKKKKKEKEQKPQRGTKGMHATSNY